MKAGVVFKTKFIAASSKAFKGYVDYIDRDEAIRTEAFGEYNVFSKYNKYMENPEKSTGLFTMEKDRLTEKQKNELKALFHQCQEKGGAMNQSIFSFRPKWLIENGLADASGNIREEPLRAYTRQAISCLTKEEGMEHWVWSAAVHYNTKHTHIHIALIDPNPSWTEGEGRCRRNHKTGELYQRGKLKPKTLEKTKARFINLALEAELENQKINSIVRDRVLAHKEMMRFYVSKEYGLQDQFSNLLAKLPSDMRLWRYNMAAMDPYRKEIDALSKQFLATYFKEDMKEFHRIVSDLSEKYQSSYGDSKRGTQFSEEKRKDLHARLGNSILAECRRVAKESRSSHIMGKYKKVPLQVQRDHIKSSVYHLRKAMKKDIESLKNQAIYERSQGEYER